MHAIFPLAHFSVDHLHAHVLIWSQVKKMVKLQEEGEGRESALQPLLAALASVPEEFTTFTKSKSKFEKIAPYISNTSVSILFSSPEPHSRSHTR
jgi:hypothetical protein